jgi:predicted DNA-binding transcriptional regulator YafY
MAKASTRRSRGSGHAERTPEVIRLLTEAGPRGLTKAEIVAKLGRTSAVSVQRTLNYLRNERDAHVTFDRSTKCWRLTRPFAMPLEAPEDSDVVAVLLAKEILAPLVDADMLARLTRVAEDLDEKRRARAGKAVRPVTARVSATLTLGTPLKTGVLRTLLQACRRSAVRIDYDAPWKPLGQGRSSREIEPWAIRIHDGAAYVRAWSREARAPRTLRVAQIDDIELLDVPPAELARVPSAAEVWGEDDPAFGIDRDRPGEAVLQIEGPVARWLHRVVWHPGQVDRWLVEGKVLERRLRYRSCRELARRVASIYDGVVRIEPEALRDEVMRIARGSELPPAVMQRRLDATPGPAAPHPVGHAADE